jgi:hypothetical protein
VNIHAKATQIAELEQCAPKMTPLWDIQAPSNGYPGIILSFDFKYRQSKRREAYIHPYVFSDITLAETQVALIEVISRKKWKR